MPHTMKVVVGTCAQQGSEEKIAFGRPRVCRCCERSEARIEVLLDNVPSRSVSGASLCTCSRCAGAGTLLPFKASVETPNTVFPPSNNSRYSILLLLLLLCYSILFACAFS